jgi:hypothetical protein
MHFCGAECNLTNQAVVGVYRYMCFVAVGVSAAFFGIGSIWIDGLEVGRFILKAPLRVCVFSGYGRLGKFRKTAG